MLISMYAPNQVTQVQVSVMTYFYDTYFYDTNIKFLVASGQCYILSICFVGLSFLDI